MSIWRKLAAATSDLLIQAQIGALLGGTAPRSGNDRSKSAPTHDSEIPFTVGVIALSAKMAKADGTVSTYEVKAFKEAFKVSPAEMKEAAHIFNLAKQDASDHAAYAKELAGTLSGDRKLLEHVLDGLFHIAKADDEMHPQEEQFLAEVAEQFGFSQSGFGAIKARHVLAAKRNPYQVLGVDPSISDAELKGRYESQMADCHPDTLIARGVPKEFLAIATEKRAALTEAYQAILKERQA